MSENAKLNKRRNSESSSSSSRLVVVVAAAAAVAAAVALSIIVPRLVLCLDYGKPLSIAVIQRITPESKAGHLILAHNFRKC